MDFFSVLGPLSTHEVSWRYGRKGKLRVLFRSAKIHFPLSLRGVLFCLFFLLVELMGLPPLIGRLGPPPFSHTAARFFPFPFSCPNPLFPGDGVQLIAPGKTSFLLCSRFFFLCDIRRLAFFQFVSRFWPCGIFWEEAYFFWISFSPRLYRYPSLVWRRRLFFLFQRHLQGFFPVLSIFLGYSPLFNVQ